MWLVMMIAMMLPSAAPMLLVFAATQRERSRASGPSPVAAFAAGYVLVWTGFSVAAAMLQAALQAGMLLSSELSVTSVGAGAAVLALAGLYQLTPLKSACLAHCQSPLGFLLGHWRDGLRGAFQLGARHGAWCVGCCWALMAALFALGAMSLGWMVFVAALIATEKLLPWKALANRGIALLLLVLGFGVAFAPESVPGLTIPSDAMGASMDTGSMHGASMGH
jgi:predicted metal-binding membrane protein